ncbi:MAG: TIGR00282 family metallophosphoesterase [Patescibacteria group bacterium]
MKLLFIGDVVGKLGRQTVAKVLPELRKREGIDFVVAQAENVTHGRGAKTTHLKELMAAGVDFFTAGPHIFYLDPEAPFSDPSIPIIRSYNLPSSAPGEGFKIVEAGRERVAVLSLLGLGNLGEKLEEDERHRPWLKGEVANPFGAAEAALKEISAANPDLILVDFHAEWSSEKRALGFFLDGRVGALVGTHTHIPTADPAILPKGTAYVTDLGMVGARDSVLGVESQIIISRLSGGEALPFQWPEEGPAVFNSVLIEIGKGNSVKRIERMDRMVMFDE